MLCCDGMGGSCPCWVGRWGRRGRGEAISGRRGFGLGLLRARLHMRPPRAFTHAALPLQCTAPPTAAMLHYAANCRAYRSDVDVVWFRNPLPYFLGPACKDADVAVSTGGCRGEARLRGGWGTLL
jgi:hypothetical protein